MFKAAAVTVVVSLAMHASAFSPSHISYALISSNSVRSRSASYDSNKPTVTTSTTLYLGDFLNQKRPKVQAPQSKKQKMRKKMTTTMTKMTQ
jgi:translation elongation factor EF-Ts